MKTSFKNVILLVLIIASPLFSPQSFADDKDDQKKVEPFSQFVPIKVGTFVMGSSSAEKKRFKLNPSDTAEQQHLVKLTNNFYIQSHETTKGEWNEIFGIKRSENPAFFKSWFNSTNDRLPMENISWWSAAWFANEASKREGLKECYKFDPEVLSCINVSDNAIKEVSGIVCDPIGDSWDLSFRKFLSIEASKGNLMCKGKLKFNTESGNGYDCEGYRLPYEAEWEYVARGWSKEKWEKFLDKYKDRKMGEYPTDAFYFGDDEKDLTRNAWVAENSGEKTHPVGTFMLEYSVFFDPPSLNHVQHDFEDMDIQRNYEIYDMVGNVAEWVQDYYGYYSNTELEKELGSDLFTNPTGSELNSYRVLRGGSWSSIPQNLRSANRNNNWPRSQGNDIGFRLVRAIKD